MNENNNDMVYDPYNNQNQKHLFLSLMRNILIAAVLTSVIVYLIRDRPDWLSDAIYLYVLFALIGPIALFFLSKIIYNQGSIYQLSEDSLIITNILINKNNVIPCKQIQTVNVDYRCAKQECFYLINVKSDKGDVQLVFPPYRNKLTFGFNVPYGDPSDVSWVIPFFGETIITVPPRALINFLNRLEQKIGKEKITTPLEKPG